MYSTLVMTLCIIFYFFFFFKDTATTEIYTLSLHDALPISPGPAIEEKRHDHRAQSRLVGRRGGGRVSSHRADGLPGAHNPRRAPDGHRRRRRRPGQGPAQEPRVARVSGGGTADSPALQAGEQRGASRGDRHLGGRRPDR